MGALGGPPEEMGHKVAAALVGTFLGILLCYGLVGPVASNMAKLADEEHAYHLVLRVVMLAFIKGYAPIQALEFGRRVTPMGVRPSFNEMEKNCKKSSSEPAAEAVAAEADGRGLAHVEYRIKIKKKGGHVGHHGGAWKVAYADFVTAMMALFIVLWLMNTSKQLQKAIGGYFKDPSGTSKLGRLRLARCGG